MRSMNQTCDALTNKNHCTGGTEWITRPSEKTRHESFFRTMIKFEGN